MQPHVLVAARRTQPAWKTLVLTGALAVILAACADGGGSGAGATAGASAGPQTGATPNGPTTGTHPTTPTTPAGPVSTIPVPAPVASALGVTVATPVWTESGHVEIEYRVADAGSLPASLRVDYSLDGGATWRPASQGIGSDGVSGLSTLQSPGQAHRFVWSSFADLWERFFGDVRVRLTATTATGAVSATSGSFPLNNGTAPGSVLLKRGPYLQNVQGAGATICWETNLGALSLVEWGDSPQLGRTSSAGFGVRHEVSITGLIPGATYYYRISNGARPLSPVERFRAAVGAGSPFRFVAFGDSGKGNQGQWDVAQALELADADFVIHTGDIVYSDGEQKDYDPRFFSPYRKLLARAPIFAAIGNHDVGARFGEAYLDNFVNPRGSGSETYYTFHYGNAQFFVLDTSYPILITAGLPQHTWFLDELARSTATWKIAVFHHPAYSSGGHGGDRFVNLFLAPQLEANGIDLVLNGHEHHYERTHPQRSTTYVVTGAGGAITTVPRPPGSWTAAKRIALHYVEITIDGNHLHGEARDPQGQAFDRFDLVK